MADRSYERSKIVDVQRRLKHLGYDLGKSDIDGIMGASTKNAVKKFQQDRGLVVTGVVDDETWQELVDAGYRIGDRLLYIKNPPFRGDDVKNLQFWLKTLGFYKYNENGIFCEKTRNALVDFQKNMKIPTDGIFGGITYQHLTSLKRIFKSERSSNYPFIKDSGDKKIAGSFKVAIDYGENINELVNKADYFKDKIYICKSIANFLKNILLENNIAVFTTVGQGDTSNLFLADRISYANKSNADLIISLNLGSSIEKDASGSSCFYFKGMKSYSVTGKEMANLIQDSIVSDVDLLDCRVHGVNYAILKETVMPAVLVEPGFISNSRDKSNLLKTGFQMKISRSIARAILDF